MDMVFSIGQMELNMRANGKIILLMVKELFGTIMVIDFKANLKILKQMDLEYIYIAMELFIKGIGLMIFHKILENNPGLMDRYIKEISNRDYVMEKANMLCLLVRAIKVNGN